MSERKIVFVPHCVLNQNIRKTNGSLKEIVKMFAEADVGMVQMPCPKAEFKGRKFKNVETYQRFYKLYCRKISSKAIKEIKDYLNEDFKVLGILGMELSPTCGVHRVENGRKITPGKGVLIDEFERGMRKDNFQVPIISVNAANIFPTLEKISLLLKNS